MWWVSYAGPRSEKSDFGGAGGNEASHFDLWVGER